MTSSLYSPSPYTTHYCFLPSTAHEQISMSSSISTILKRQTEIIAKVKGARYLESRVSENLLVLQQCLVSHGLSLGSDEDLTDDDLNAVDLLALNELRTLGANTIFFSARDYIAYRPFPLNLTSNGALSFMRKEFSKWLRLNRLQNELLAHSKRPEPNDNLLRAVVSKLAVDSAKSDDWVAMATERSASESSFPITRSELENLSREECERDTKNRYRQLFVGHIVERAIEVNVPLREWSIAYERTICMSQLISGVQSTVAREHRSEFLDVWKKSFPSSNKAESDIAENS